MSVAYVYVVDAWDDDAEESHVRVLTTAEKARRELEPWKAAGSRHNLFAGVLKRRVLCCAFGRRAVGSVDARAGPDTDVVVRHPFAIGRESSAANCRPSGVDHWPSTVNPRP